MEKSQYNLLSEVLKRFDKKGLLNNFILIGSWCLPVYKDCFRNKEYSLEFTLKTRDVDFLVNDPNKIKNKVDIPELFRDLGFVTIFKGRQGYLKLDHPELLIEFLTPEKGREWNTLRITSIYISVRQKKYTPAIYGWSQ